MRISSTDNYLIAHLGEDKGTIHWYKGSHTANIYNEFGENTDGFTFAWHKDKASMLDFTTALASYLSEE